jgi:putative hydrolase of the HAD superfamily
MIYIGDNPNKDFINLKKIGIRTARIFRGSFKAVKLDESFEAEFCLKT